MRATLGPAGGTRDLLPIFSPTIPGHAVDAVVACLRSGRLSEGAKVKEFEDALRARFRLPRALALNSGTAGLHLAMLGAGVGPGDEVITTALTFVATAMAIVQAGGTPVFADIVAGGPNVDPVDIESRITERTKAIVVVHYGGYPCDMDAISALAARFGLSVIEDAAHALGATYHDKPAGTLGDFGVFSFQAIKLLTTGDGGLLVCADEDCHREALRRRWFGIDRERRRASEMGEPQWDITEIGYKYHMNDIAAALGIPQLDSFQNAQARRRELNRTYRSRLGGLDGLELLEERPDRESACWLFTLRVQRRTDFIRALRSRGVEAAVWHRRIDAHTIFGGIRSDLSHLAEFDATQVSIPMRATLTEEDVETVLTAVEAGW